MGGSSLSRLHRNTSLPVPGWLGNQISESPVGRKHGGASVDFLAGPAPLPTALSDWNQQAGDKVTGAPPLTDEPPVPAIPPPTPMPIPGQDDPTNIAARRRSIQAQLARRGRLATILTQPQAEPLGG